jgi:hypothetical protein
MYVLTIGTVCAITAAVAAGSGSDWMSSSALRKVAACSCRSLRAAAALSGSPRWAASIAISTSERTASCIMSASWLARSAEPADIDASRLSDSLEAAVAAMPPTRAANRAPAMPKATIWVRSFMRVVLSRTDAPTPTRGRWRWVCIGTPAAVLRRAGPRRAVMGGVRQVRPGLARGLRPAGRAGRAGSRRRTGGTPSARRRVPARASPPRAAGAAVPRRPGRPGPGR